MIWLVIVCYINLLKLQKKITPSSQKMFIYGISVQMMFIKSLKDFLYLKCNVTFNFCMISIDTK